MSDYPKKLSSEEEISKAMTAFYEVFNTVNTSVDPFTAKIETKIILYNEFYRVDEEHMTGIAKSALAIDDKSIAYLTMAEGYESFDFKEHDHWAIDLFSHPYPYDSLDQDPDWVPIVESAIYSSSGKWGIIFSADGQTILGGPKLFVETLKKNVPEVDEEVYWYLDDVIRFIRPKTIDYYRNWLPGFLSSIYGKERSMELLNYRGLLKKLST